MATQNTPVDELTFKQASMELEGIVRALETGDLELEQTLEQYSRGVKLLGSLKNKLATAEQQVQQLLSEMNDEEEQDFDTVSAPATAFSEEI